MKVQGAGKQIQAKDLREGQLLVDVRADRPLKVLAVKGCGDGSLRVFHTLGESRMTGSVRVRVVH